MRRQDTPPPLFSCGWRLRLPSLNPGVSSKGHFFLGTAIPCFAQLDCCLTGLPILCLHLKPNAPRTLWKRSIFFVECLNERSQADYISVAICKGARNDGDVFQTTWCLDCSRISRFERCAFCSRKKITLGYCNSSFLRVGKHHAYSMPMKNGNDSGKIGYCILTLFLELTNGKLKPITTPSNWLNIWQECITLAVTIKSNPNETMLIWFTLYFNCKIRRWT